MDTLKELQSVVVTRDYEGIPRGTIAVVMAPPVEGFVSVELIERPPGSDLVRYLPVDALAPYRRAGETAAA